MNADARSTITIEEAETKRTVDWQGNINADGTMISVKQSSIHGYRQIYSVREGDVVFKREEGRHHIKEEIVIYGSVN